MLLKHRRAAAIKSMELAFSKLLLEARGFADTAMPNWQRADRECALAAAARRYTRSLDRVRRT